MPETTLDSRTPAEYEAEIRAWRQHADDRLRADDGWLTLVGLYWLHEGRNTVGRDPACDILLPDSAPQTVGFVDFRDRAATLQITDPAEVMVEGDPVKAAALRDDTDPQGATRVEIGGVNFFVIRRGDQYGIRVRDRNHPARGTFAGRQWLAVDPDWRAQAIFKPHSAPRTLEVVNTLGMPTPMENPGWVEFALGERPVRMEAFRADNNELWFIFKDTHPQTYKGGRFLFAPFNPDATVTLDFNKAYNPPCAFTAYATCPLAPPENILPFAVEAGEIAPAH